MTTYNAINQYPTEPVVKKGELPDPFATAGGTRITTRNAWPEQSRIWRDMILEMEYGGLPPAPNTIEVEPLCHNRARRVPGAPNNWSYRIHCNEVDRSFAFCGRLIFPSTPSGPFPVIVNGDGCWWYPSDDIIQRVIESGCALLIFNRTEMAEDLGYEDVPDKRKKNGGLYDFYPGQTFGALSAWAWGYHRCIDFLQTLPFIDNERIAVTGHSRGGKTALLAGATDERIALVNDNASCAGGSAAFRYVGDGGETLNIMNVFPSWFGLGLQLYLDQEGDIPFDQHCLLATIAPRPLLLTYALDDRWSNPEGMVQCAWGVGEVYKFLGRPENLAFHLRQGGHAHASEDWDVLLDFIAWKWKGKDPEAPYNRHPYVHLHRLFSWKTPDMENIGQPAGSGDA
jgi:hypothetical protein